MEIAGVVLPRVESAHVVITLHPSIHDRSVTLLSNAFLCDFMVHPVGVAPHGVVYFTELDGRTGVVGDRVLKLLIEVSIVQEHVRIVPPSVKVPLNGLEGLNDALQFLISRKDDESGVRSGTGRVDGQAAGGEDLIMLLADFSIQARMNRVSVAG
jgi:hypothetical protein